MEWPASLRRGRIVDVGIVAFLVGLFAIDWMLCQVVEDIAPDSSTYQGLAHSLLTTGTYTFNFVPHTQYPPGLPLWLAAVALVGGEVHLAYLHAQVFVAIGALALTYAFGRLMQGRPFAVTATVLLGASYYYFIWTTFVLNSDVPYLAASLAALVCGQRLVGARTRGGIVGWSVAFAAALLAATLMRSAGVALVAAYCGWWLVALVRTRRFAGVPARLTLPVFVAGSAEVAWWLRAHVVKAQSFAGWGNAYEDQFRLLDPHDPSRGYASVGQILARIPDNLTVHAGHLFELATNAKWTDSTWSTPLILVPILLIATGVVVSLRKRPNVLELYFVLYAAVYSMWPYDVGARFVLPIFPVALLYAWRGAAAIAEGWRSDAATTATAGLAVASVAGLASTLAIVAGGSASTQLRIAPWFWLALGIVCACWIAPAVRARAAPFVERLRRVAPFAGAALLGVLAVRGLLDEVSSGLFFLHQPASTIIHAASGEASAWLKGNTRADDVVMAEQLPIVHAMTGRRIAGFPATLDVRTLTDTMRASGTAYLVVIDTVRASAVEPTQVKRLDALERGAPGLLEPVARGTGFRIFRVDLAKVPPAAS